MLIQKYPRLFCGIMGVGLAGLVIFSGLGERVDQTLFHFLFDKIGTRFRPNPEIILLCMDDLPSRGPQGGIDQQGGWSRERIARLVEECREADVLGIDMLLLRQAPEEDAALALALKHHGRVVLTGTFGNGMTRELAFGGDTFPAKSLLPLHPAEDKAGVETKPLPPFIGPSPEFGDVAHRIGFSNLSRRAQGLLWAYEYGVDTPRGRLPSLALAMLLSSHRHGINTQKSMANPTYPGQAKGLVFYHDGFIRVSAREVLRGTVPPHWSRGKMVLLGMESYAPAEGAWMFGSPEPQGLEIHATALSNWLQRTWMLSLSPSRVVILTCVFGLFPLFTWRETVTSTWMFSVMLLIIYHVLLVTLFYFMPFRLPWMAPLLVFGLTLFFRMGDSHFKEVRERRKLEDRQRVKQVLTNTLVHDLNTPINNMIMLLETVLPDPALETKSKRRLESAIQEGSRITYRLRTLLDIDRMESGRLDLVIGEVSWNRWMQIAVQKHATTAAEEKIKVMTRFEAPEMFIHGDGALLERILDYLMEGALHYAREGSELKVESEWVQENLLCRIIADGELVDQAEIASMFEPFLNIKKSSQSREEGGFGWGLAFCKLAITAHGGELKAKSPRPEQKDGLVLELRIPRHLNRVR